ncbi:MAG: glycosyltransferase family 39 protein [Lachnospiraceae bacterium]|nr:glycosyltransferase family 39 protein [Lachnospiraceae bacterium]
MKAGKAFLSELGKEMRQGIRSVRSLHLAVFLGLCCFLSTFLYYKGVRPNNFPAGYFWLLSMFCLFAAFFREKQDTLADRWKNLNKKKAVLFLLLTVVYFISHLWNYAAAPWNDYGLFDDAAWDIYFAEQKCFRGDCFEIIFWDDTVGRISRELLFHYYVSVLFRLFGYNMRVFNMALVLLGYVTVLFTGLWAADLLEDDLAGFMAGILLNFFPLHYTQVFMGHRYAICTPVMAVSLYCIYRAFRGKKLSYFIGNSSGIFIKQKALRAECSLAREENAAFGNRARRERSACGTLCYGIVGGIFAGFTMESAVMGKQYLWGLLGTAVICAVMGRRRVKQFMHRYGAVLLTVLLGYAAAAAPLYAYIWTHGELYRIREADLFGEFLERLKTEGLVVLKDNLVCLRETMFAEYSGNRQFSSGFPVLTWYMAVPVLAGMVVSLWRKHVFPVLMCLIPLAGNCVTTAYDFRILLAAPVMAVLMASAIDQGERVLRKRLPKEWFGRALAWLLAALLLVQPVRYLWKLSKTPDGQYLMQHQDLAVCRYFQDLAAGAEDADFGMQKDEFCRPQTETDYDLLAATRTSYAHIHAFLEPFGDRKILRLFDDFPYISKGEEDLRDCMKRTMQEYVVTEKDLLIALEYSDQLQGIIEDIQNSGMAVTEWDQAEIDGRQVQVCICRIPQSALAAFRDYILYIYR